MTRAVVLRETGRPMAVEPITLPDVGSDDVRVCIDAVGVCHSDLSLARGVLAQPTPAVLGHEACGTVIETGADVSGVDVGTRVILLWQAPCRQCAACRRGEAHLCADIATRAREPYATDRHGAPLYQGLSVGAFADETVVPQRAVVPIPDHLSARDAALLGCAVTTGVGAVINTAAVAAGDTVCVIGLGGVGLSAVQGARLAGASTIVAVDRNADKFDVARTLGATHTAAADDGLRTAVREITGEGVDHAFDCVGSAATIRAAWSVSRRGGSVTVVGVGAKDDIVEFSALELFHFARTLRGCVAGSIDPTRDLPRFFDWVRDGRLDLASLHSDTGGLDDVEPALDALRRGHGVRTIITPGADRA